MTAADPPKLPPTWRYSVTPRLGRWVVSRRSQYSSKPTIECDALTQKAAFAAMAECAAALAATGELVAPLPVLQAEEEHQ